MRLERAAKQNEQAERKAHGFVDAVNQEIVRFLIFYLLDLARRCYAEHREMPLTVGIADGRIFNERCARSYR